MASLVYERENCVFDTCLSLIKVSVVRRSRLGICYFKEKLCFAHVGKSLARCLLLKRSKDLVKKNLSPVKFDTNRSLKQ